MRTECKKCSYLVWKKNRDINSEIISNKKKENYTNNREKILDRAKKYRQENIYIIRKKDRVRSKKRYEKNPEVYREYYNKNKESISLYKKTWAVRNYEKIKKTKKRIY